jgi:hypothetical protein
MEHFKIIFPSGYQIRDIYNDNIDVNVILPDNTVFFGTLFTLQNIQEIMKKTNDLYFWSTDMIVVQDLKKESIYNVVNKVLEEEYLPAIFSKIGMVENIFPEFKSFEDIGT